MHGFAVPLERVLFAPVQWLYEDAVRLCAAGWTATGEMGIDEPRRPRLLRMADSSRRPGPCAHLAALLYPGAQHATDSSCCA